MSVTCDTFSPPHPRRPPVEGAIARPHMLSRNPHRLPLGGAARGISHPRATAPEAKSGGATLDQFLGPGGKCHARAHATHEPGPFFLVCGPPIRSNAPGGGTRSVPDVRPWRRRHHDECGTWGPGIHAPSRITTPDSTRACFRFEFAPRQHRGICRGHGLRNWGWRRRIAVRHL